MRSCLAGDFTDCPRSSADVPRRETISQTLSKPMPAQGAGSFNAFMNFRTVSGYGYFFPVTPRIKYTLCFVSSTRFGEVLKDFWERRRKRRPGAISAPCGASTEPQASRPSVTPSRSLLRAFALRRGNVAPHTRRAVPTPRGGTLRRECSAGATAFYRPSFHYGRHKAKKQGNAYRFFLKFDIRKERSI